MMTSSHRVVRVEREILRVLNTYIQQQISEPIAAHASVTSVHVSPNLRSAKVFVRVIGEGPDVHAMEELLQSHRTAMQSEINRDLHRKFSPVLHFNVGAVKVQNEVDRLFAQLRTRHHDEIA